MTKPTTERQQRFGIGWWLRWPLLVVFAALAVLLHSALGRLTCGLMVMAQCLYIADGIVQRGHCGHQSHRLNIPCLRERTYDGYCAHHNNSCWSTHG